MMLGNPVVADGAELVHAHVTRSRKNDDQQRDNASNQTYRRSYPEHSALSVKHDRFAFRQGHDAFVVRLSLLRSAFAGCGCGWSAPSVSRA
jgi:hypothetical protein